MADTIHFDEERLDSELKRVAEDFTDSLRKYADALRNAKVEEGVPATYLFENLWQQISSETRVSLVELIHGSIESIDESDLIDSKKENS